MYGEDAFVLNHLLGKNQRLIHAGNLKTGDLGFSNRYADELIIRVERLHSCVCINSVDFCYSLTI